MYDRHLFGEIEIRPLERTLLRGGEEQRVGARAFDLLLALIERGGALVTKDELLDAVWPGLVVEEANVQVQVSSLRKVLGPRAIATVPGLGYRFAMANDEPLARSNDSLAPADAAAASPVSAPRDHNLPPERERLIGRAIDVESLSTWIGEHTLVTVHGPGGIGKTRTAQAVAWKQRGLHRHGVWWVDLAAVDDPALVAIAIANAAQLQLGAGAGEPIDALTSALATRELLLVLDNCERLVAAVGRFALALQRGAPGVRLLVTSQERLNVGGEHVYRLEPLATPSHRVDLVTARGFAAVELLEQRARAADRRFMLDEHNLGAALTLVRRLDGIALAIEMAAARIPLLGLDELANRLDQHLRLLRLHDRGGAPPRQRTLQATLEWSHALLDGEEQALLASLSTFAGSFSVESACCVGADAQHVGDEWRVLDLLSDLIDKSLVQLDRREHGDPPRYRLLETMRLFAAARLAESAQSAAAEQRHGVAMVALARRVEDDYWQLPDRIWLARYAADYDDLQVAFERACTRRDAEVAALTGNALARIDHLRNVHALRRHRAEALHALLPLASPSAAAWIWNCIASHGLIALEVVSRLVAAAEAVAAWRRVGDQACLYFALGFQAAECSRALDFEAADRAMAEARALEEPSWPLRRLMWGASAAAGVSIHRGDAAEYRRASRSELELAERAGAERAAAWARLKLADAALMAGDHDEAITLGRAAAAQLRTLDQPSNLGLALSNLCAAWLATQQFDEARDAAREALPLLWQNGWGYLLLDSISLIACRRGHPDGAAQLLGFASGWYEAHADQRQPNEVMIARRAADELAGALGPERLAALQSEGARLNDAAARALAGTLLD